MGVVQVQLPEDLKDIIDRQIAEGRATSADAYVENALRLYADHLEAEDEIADMVERADTDIVADRYVTVSTHEDNEALHQRMLARLQANLANDTAAR